MPSTVDKNWYEQCAAKHKAERAGWRTGPWSRDGRKVLVFSARGVGVGVWDLRRDKIDTVSGVGSDATWLADGRRIVVAHDSRVLLVDTRNRKTGELVSLAPHKVTVLPAIDISPDQRTIYVSTLRQTITMWLVDFVDSK